MKFWKKKINNEDTPIEATRSIEVLAPRLLNDNDSAYHCVEELRLAMNHPDCLNIALTGGFGSGKSSVLKTFIQEDGAKYNYLKISLSNFVDEEAKIDDKYENMIESKIFQHILYKANHDKTSKTNYRRIKFIPIKTAVMKAIAILTFILSYIIVFEPECIRIDAIYDVYHKVLDEDFAYWLNIVGDIAASIYMFLAIGHVIGVLYRRLKPISIKSFKVDEFALDFESGKSAFKELLGEILYFFKAGGYNLIIFEDLDRIKDPKNLFLKFREVNQLLNESDYFRKTGRKIRFIYAIKDDVFVDEIRTKFFDYMIPVVPVVDSFNAGDYMIGHYRNTEFDNIDSKDITSLGLYISTMRALTNIVNEYRVYKDVLLQGGMSQRKLLASIIYKNSYPGDYSLYHSKEGSLYKVLHNPTAFTKILTQKDDALLVQLDERIKTTREGIVGFRKQVLGWLDTNHFVKKLIIKDSQYELDEIAQNDELFELFEHDKYDKYYFETFDEVGTDDYTFKFSAILSSVENGNDNYDGMLNEIRTLSSLRSKRLECINRISLTTSLSLQDVIAKIDDTDRTLSIVYNICKTENKIDDVQTQKTSINSDDEQHKSKVDPAVASQAEIIHTFIKNGFIEDDFDAYISYSYPGAKSPTDFKFLHSVLQGVSMPYDTKLDNTEEVLNSLHTGNLESKEALNFSLVEYLLSSKNDALVQTYFKMVRKHLDFVVKFYESGRMTKDFYDALFYKWDGCVEDIVRDMAQDANVLFELLFAASSQTCILKENEKNILSEKYQFICDKIDKFEFKRLKGFVSYYSLSFANLVKPNEGTQRLFNYVTEYSYFEINLHNLKLIYGDEFEKKSYTSIIKGDEKIRTYLLQNIKEVVSLFPETNTEESVEAIANLSHNDKVDDEMFEQFLASQTAVLENFNDVKKERIPMFFKTDKIMATWENVKQFFTSSDENSIIVPFIIKHANDLEGKKINEDEDELLQKLLMNDNSTLPIDVYKRLLPSCGYIFEADEIKDLNEERLRAILNADYVEYNKDTKQLYSSKGDELFGDYLVHFFKDFKKDEAFGIKLTNKTAICILNSHLTLIEKKYFIDKLASPIDDEYLEEYSRLICFYYLQMEINEETDVEILKNALKNCGDKDTWKIKIDLINKINQVVPYNKNIETELIVALGGGYLKLNSYKGSKHYDDKEENWTLLNYLRSKGHYVNNVKDDNGRIKVTFKNPPSEERQ